MDLYRFDRRYLCDLQRIYAWICLASKKQYRRTGVLARFTDESIYGICIYLNTECVCSRVYSSVNSLLYTNE